jgi:hypothetical protein
MHDEPPERSTENASRLFLNTDCAESPERFTAHTANNPEAETDVASTALVPFVTEAIYAASPLSKRRSIPAMPAVKNDVEATTAVPEAVAVTARESYTVGVVPVPSAAPYMELKGLALLHM